jgi:hypothetical protein
MENQHNLFALSIPDNCLKIQYVMEPFRGSVANIAIYSTLGVALLVLMGLLLLLGTSK